MELPHPNFYPPGAIAPKFELGVLATLLGSSTLVIMSGATIAPALPAIQLHFAGVEDAAYWVRFALTTPALAIALSSPVAGLLVDRLGRKPLLWVSVLLFSLSGSAGLYLDSLPAIIATRALLGLAAAGANAAVITLIADYYADKVRAKLLGWQSAAIGLAGFAILSLSGNLAELNWRAPFAIYLSPLLLLPAIAIYLFEPDPRSQSDSSTVPSPQPVANALPRFPWSAIAFIYVLEFCHLFFFYLTPVQLPFYLEENFGLSASRTGWALATLTLFQVGISLAYGRLQTRLRFIGIVAIGFAVAGIGYSALAFALNYNAIVACMAVSGLGFGLLFPNAKTWVCDTAPEAFRGRAIAGLMSAFFLGEFLSPAASQPAVDRIGIRAMYSSVGFVLFSIALSALGIWGWQHRQEQSQRNAEL